MTLFRVQENCLRSGQGIVAENWLVTNDEYVVVLNNEAEANMVCNMVNDMIKNDFNNTENDRWRCGMTKKVKQNVPTPVTVKFQVLSEVDDIPLDILETAIRECLNVKMNVLGIHFSSRGIKND